MKNEDFFMSVSQEQAASYISPVVKQELEYISIKENIILN